MARLYLSDYRTHYENEIVRWEKQAATLSKTMDRERKKGGLLLFNETYQNARQASTVALRGLSAARKKLEETPTFEKAIKTYYVENSRVLWLIEKHFNLEEIKTLTFELDIDYDTLAGQEKSSKARELILTSERSGKLKILVANARMRRPTADWDSCLYKRYLLLRKK